MSCKIKIGNSNVRNTYKTKKNPLRKNILNGQVLKGSFKWQNWNIKRKVDFSFWNNMTTSHENREWGMGYSVVLSGCACTTETIKSLASPFLFFNVAGQININEAICNIVSGGRGWLDEKDFFIQKQSIIVSSRVLVLLECLNTFDHNCSCIPYRSYHYRSLQYTN